MLAPVAADAASVSGCHDEQLLMITGSTGYLGRALVDLLVRRGVEVRAAVRDPSRAADVLPSGWR